ncbi:MAG: hypothetical protein NTW21_30590 [Verrucomicrobia bacterium]|nr:hypothetical protein [Verrucomicrobiota bacterium]
MVGFTYHQWWYSCHTGVILYLLDFLPSDEMGAHQKPASMPIGQPTLGRIVEIHPGVMWKDEAGHDITAHGGCVIKVGRSFYRKPHAKTKKNGYRWTSARAS